MYKVGNVKFLLLSTYIQYYEIVGILNAFLEVKHHQFYAMTKAKNSKFLVLQKKMLIRT